MERQQSSSSRVDPRFDIGVEFDSLPRINYAMHQNGTPLVREVVATNASDRTVEDFVLRIHSGSPAVEAWETRVERLDPGEFFRVVRPGLRLDRRALFNQDERERSEIQAEVLQNGAVLGAASRPLEVLAYNEWAGIEVLPELLAAFVQPNHSDLQPLLGQIRDHLLCWTEDPSLSGYQRRDSARVRLTVAAVYKTLQDLGITYVNPPASFEVRGQKIRTVEDVLRTKMGTCLDLAVLSAALLEQVGLHPLLPLFPGHAFAGCWLAEETFPEVVHDDPARLRNGIRLGELLVFDPTLATNRPSPPFERAERVGEEHLGIDEATGRRPFSCVVDVRSARALGVHPIPARIRPAEYEDVSTPSSPPLPDSAPGGSDELRARADRAARADARQRVLEETPRSRIDWWKTQLLDLTRRNRLLNFRDTPKAKVLEVLTPNLGELEDMLAAGVSFTVRPRPERLVSDGGADSEGDSSAMVQYLDAEIQARRLCAPYPLREIERRLLTIYRTARTNRQESGASMLFLAFGFLRWFEDKKGRRDSLPTERLAPLLLLPLELRRENVGAPFDLSLADDEARLNTTLLEMLRKEHGLEVRGLDPPPEDASGLDIDEVITQFRRAVRHKPGWEVVERAFVGLFSFAKFLMWHDLEARREELFAHPVVRHLAGEGVLHADSIDAFPDARRLDDDLHPSDSYCPLDADSSQLAAILAAAQGRTFVLEGPPGTGKSQTIANLITHCVGTGKTVLFVSAKMAALEVVYRRLVKVGLGPYCLELHSNKAKKRVVIEQLAAALAAGRQEGVDRWRERGDLLHKVRADLNDYVTALHQPRRLGHTVFEVTSELVALRDVPLVRLSLGGSERLGAKRWREIIEIGSRMETALSAVGSVSSHPFRAVQRDDLSPAEQAELSKRYMTLRDAADNLRVKSEAVRAELRVDALPDDRRGTALLLEIADLLTDAPGVTRALLEEPGWTSLRGEVEEWARHSRSRCVSWAPLAETWNTGLLELPLERLKARFERWGQAFFLVAIIMLWSARRLLKTVRPSGRLPRNRDLTDILAQATVVRREDEFLLGSGAVARRLFGRRWRGSDTDWDALLNDLSWAERYRQVVARVSDQNANLATARSRLIALASSEVERLAPDTELGSSLQSLRNQMAVYEAARSDLASSLDLDELSAWGEGGDTSFLSDVAERCDECVRRLPELRDWLLYARVRRDAYEAELGDFVTALDKGHVSPENVSLALRKSVLLWWLDATTGNEEVLRLFHGAEHVRKVDTFRQLDRELLELAARETCARVSADTPEVSHAVARTSALGILQNEIHKRKRHLPIRRLFEQTGDLIPRLTPCILMSPKSVAQYLDPQLPQFDLVVFDEASQVPVWDAIGAIARGKQIVVVGDPKQLPPTSFFQRGDTDDDLSEEYLVEHESILDECMAAGLPKLSLGWHYRSQHEHLIAFSNHHYYGNGLLTFPSAEQEAEGLGVSWKHVPGGTYDRGKNSSHTNRAEADEVAAEVVRRLEDPELRHCTIGVVTFSQKQQKLIEDLLEKERRSHPNIERFFHDDEVEPVFVKNLENVQGDERDTILLSVCYGPDAEGRVSMNFGPLNRKGGDRRLNVAITRARRELIVFSTLRPEQIDLNRTSADGVAHLKSFLAYADQGPDAIAAEVTSGFGDDFDSPFEADVCAALRARGFLVDSQVGCSGYRIDLAVRHPKSPGRYAIGVECDGWTYHSAATARDRDRIRQAVLEGLGWRITRIWSTDWFHDRTNQLERLVAEVQDAIETTSTTTELEQTPSRADSVSDDTAPPAPSTPANKLSATDQVRKKMRVWVRTVGNCGLPGARPYTVHRVTSVDMWSMDTDRQSEDAAIRTALVEIVRNEGPIHIELAVSRVGKAVGRRRISKKFGLRVLSTLQGDRDEDVRRFGDFLWLIQQNPAELEGFRVPDERDHSTRRSAEEIPAEEIANAMHVILERNVHLAEDDLLRETAKVFGINRLGKKVREEIARGLALLQRQGRCVRDGKDVRLP